MIHNARNILLLIVLCYVVVCGGWKAIPANQATYALRAWHPNVRKMSDLEAQVTADFELPRDKINFIYKFGHCEPDAIRRQFLRKSVNITLPTWQSAQLNFIYLVARKHTINRDLQCIVMKAFVSRKFLFKKSRLPLYYCQGTVHVLMLNTINRYEIHEFFLHHDLNVPMDFSFEFYHPLTEA